MGAIIEYENVERLKGETKWSFWKLFQYSIDGIINFSQVPLSIASWGGIALTALSFVMIAFIVVRKLLFGDPVAGWPASSPSSEASSSSAWALWGSIWPKRIWK